MEKDYVSYELSLALKAAGFDEPCDCYYKLSKWVRRGRFPEKKKHPQRYKGYLDLIKEEPRIELINDDGITNRRLTDNAPSIMNWADECVMPHCEYATAVSLWHAQKWLRKKKGIDVLVYNCACGYLWEVSKAMNGTGLILFDEKGDDENSGCWTSYEAALSAGIAAALQLVKKGE